MAKFGALDYIKQNSIGLWAIASRADFLELERANASAIANIYKRASKEVAGAIRNLGPAASPLTLGGLKELEKQLTFQAATVGLSLHDRLMLDIPKAAGYGAAGVQIPFAVTLAEAGAMQTGLITMNKLGKAFAGVNTIATQAQYARTINGLTLSPRIWSLAGNFRTELKELIDASVASGLGAKETAKLVEVLAEKGGYQLKKTVIKDYPKAWDRMGHRSWPKNTNWEALRLARTELAYAYNEGAVIAGRMTPGYIGSRWMLSDEHPFIDICDEYAESDSWGLGPGVYPEGEEPVFAHPNCLCYLVPVFESREQLLDDIRGWIGGGSNSTMDKWYTEVYQGK